jgi:DNA-directed RNA polymerase II subunit RPB2
LYKNEKIIDFPKDISIVLEKHLYIYCDASRPIRPLLIVEDNQLVIKKKNLLDAPIAILLANGAIEYVDPFEQEFIHCAENMAQLDARQQQIKDLTENVKRGEKFYLDQLQSIQTYPYTHCELDPIALMGVSIGIVPLFNHNQAPRNTYQANMGRQSLSIPHDCHMLRFDTTSKVLINPTRSLFESQTNRIYNMTNNPSGQHLIVAVMPMKGYNQEDSFVINRQSLDIGKLRTYKYMSFEETLCSTKEFIDEFTKPIPRQDESEENYQHIDEHGLPILNAYVKVGDCIIGKIRKNQVNKKSVINISKMVSFSEEGYIDRVEVLLNAKKKLTVKVKIRQYRIPVEGDKFAPQCAQKGTVSLICNPEDMPFVAYGRNRGMKPDLIINPHCIPSRMTMSLIYELIGIKSAAIDGKRRNATAFRQPDIQSWMNVLHESGLNKYGYEQLIDGRKGNLLNAQIYMGPIYYQVLKHMVKDKIQMRAKGDICATTHQPIHGKKNNGGLRFGEMERDSLISHGASDVMKDRLMLSSDAYRVTFCITCGNFASIDAKNKKYFCNLCENKAEFGIVTLPYGYKLLMRTLNTGNIQTLFQFKKLETV